MFRTALFSALALGTVAMLASPAAAGPWPAVDAQIIIQPRVVVGHPRPVVEERVVVVERERPVVHRHVVVVDKHPKAKPWKKQVVCRDCDGHSERLEIDRRHAEHRGKARHHGHDHRAEKVVVIRR